jgi:hypothetical protein
VTGKLNTVNDLSPGGALVAKTGTGYAPGQVGQRIYFSHEEVKYDPTIGTLYGGGYQYVKTHPQAASAITRGRIAFWYDMTNYIVTSDPVDGNHAGVFLNSVTRGYYCYIQYSGKASLLFDAALAVATPAVKDLVVQKTAANTGDVVADATTVTGSILKRRMGVAWEAPVAGQIKLVELYEDFKIV